jgi:septal ring factor EnvC (AmiA/AmiB activator)
MDDLSMMKREILLLEPKMKALEQKNGILEKKVEELTKEINKLACDIRSTKWEQDEKNKRVYAYIDYWLNKLIDFKKHKLTYPTFLPQKKTKWCQLKERWF